MRCAQAEFLRRSFEQNIGRIGASSASSQEDRGCQAAGGPPEELLSELSAEEHAVPCHPLEDLDSLLDDAWFFGSFSTPAPSYAGSVAGSLYG